MLDRLRDSMHYTYSFYPNDDTKQEVPIKIWQRPTYNWKLECENRPGMSLNDVTTSMIEGR